MLKNSNIEAIVLEKLKAFIREKINNCLINVFNSIGKDKLFLLTNKYIKSITSFDIYIYINIYLL